MLNVLARVVGKMDKAILGINHYPVDGVEFLLTLSIVERYPSSLRTTWAKATRGTDYCTGHILQLQVGECNLESKLLWKIQMAFGLALSDQNSRRTKKMLKTRNITRATQIWLKLFKEWTNERQSTLKVSEKCAKLRSRAAISDSTRLKTRAILNS